MLLRDRFWTRPVLPIYVNRHGTLRRFVLIPRASLRKEARVFEIVEFGPRKYSPDDLGYTLNGNPMFYSLFLSLCDSVDSLLWVSVKDIFSLRIEDGRCSGKGRREPEGEREPPREEPSEIIMIRDSLALMPSRTAWMCIHASIIHGSLSPSFFPYFFFTSRSCDSMQLIPSRPLPQNCISSHLSTFFIIFYHDSMHSNRFYNSHKYYADYCS